MSSIKPPIAILYKSEVKYILSSALKVLTIQVLFNISTSNIYLQDVPGTNYFPNLQGEFLDINKDILLIQPSEQPIKLESIMISKTDSRYLHTSGDYIGSEHLFTGYSTEYKNLRRSFIKFDDLSSINGKQIIKAYLHLTGKARDNGSPSAPKEVFVHRVRQSYGNIVKWADHPLYISEPEASIMVGETIVEIFLWDITYLVKGWVDKTYPNYGLLLKQNDPMGVESHKYYYQNIKIPQIEVIYLVPS